jgi:hypothetical protein
MAKAKAKPKAKRATVARKPASRRAPPKPAVRAAAPRKRKPAAKRPAAKRTRSMSTGKVAAAAALFESFHDYKPAQVRRVQMPHADTLVQVGRLLAVAYQRPDGKRYVHKFKPSARPTLAASHDGSGLFVVGGRFRFTERGILDK